MEDAMRIMEEILETEYKGLVYINETREIGSYSRCAKKITGILLDSEQRHPGGRIEEGDIVIIADNELGNDDELTPESLETIGIADRNIEKDDALLAVGVYKNKKIQPQYKYIKSYNPNGRFELVTDYLGFEIVIRIDFAHNHVHISVNGDTYSMVYFEAVGHMVVIDSVTGKIKFFQARGYGFRGEEIGKLLAGKPYLPKTDYETSGELMPTVGLNFESIIYGDEILKEINKMFAAPDGHTESGIFEIYKRPMFCVLTRIRKGNARDGIYLILQDASLLENVRKERDSIIQALEQRQKKKFMRRPYGCDFQGAKMEDFIGEDPAMNEVKRLAYKASQTDFNVIITGESGTGKSRLAKEIHRMGKKDAPFVEVNCNAIAPSLFESELFGYAPGAFTGAAANGKAGFFEEANGGTIFLDEIGEIPFQLQGKLLEVLQSKTFFHVGGTRQMTSDVRLIAATNKNLKEMVREKRFREDLFYRINVFPIDIPPLRERRGGLYSIVMDILPDVCNRLGIEPLVLSSQAYKKILQYPWPGNIRELENVLEKAAILSDGKIILPDDVLLPDAADSFMAVPATLQEIKESAERNAIVNALRLYQGDKEKAAEYLAIGRSNIFDKIKKYHIRTDEVESCF